MKVVYSHVTNSAASYGSGNNEVTGVTAREYAWAGADGVRF